MMHRIPTDRLIAVWVVLGVVGLAGISPAPAMAQVSAEAVGQTDQAGPGAGGDPLGVGAHAEQPDEYRC